MADTPGQQQQQIQLRIDESKMESTYANTIRTTTTQDEVIFDFGVNLPVPGDNNQPTLLFAVGSRVIMNWGGAKRLAISLSQLIRQYEERNGEISLQPKGGTNPPAGGSPRLAN
jgi:hypothetical protein